MMLHPNGPKCISAVKQIVPASLMFYHPAHRTLADAIYALNAQPSAVDLVTVKTHLAAKGKLAEVGGEDWLIQVGERVPSASNAVHYAHIVRRGYARRIIQTRAKQLHYAASTGSDFDEIFKLATEVSKGQLMPQQFAFAAGEADIHQIEYPTGVKTGWPAIDDMTSMGGIPKKQCTVVGALTGIGKSLIAQQVVLHVAKTQGRVAYLMFGADLDRDMLEARWVKQICGFSPRAGLDLMQQGEVDAAYASLAKLPITMYESELAPDRTVETAIEWIKHENKISPFELVAFDYAQEMRTNQPKYKRFEEVEHCTREVAASAKPLGCAVMLLTQMTGKDSEDFRYSQEIKNTAGFAMIVRREKDRLMDGRSNATATIIKNRWGHDGELRGKWNPRYLQFEDWTSE